jgi:hypothetical protein
MTIQNLYHSSLKFDSVVYISHSKASVYLNCALPHCGRIDVLLLFQRSNMHPWKIRKPDSGNEKWFLWRQQSNFLEFTGTPTCVQWHTAISIKTFRELNVCSDGNLCMLTWDNSILVERITIKNHPILGGLQKSNILQQEFDGWSREIWPP